MKRLDNLWPQVIAFDNLWQAWRKARRGKSRSTNVTRFELDLERNLLKLQSELQTGEYRPGHYHLFTIYERKPRLIAAAPFRDRVVHHAIMNLIEPPLDRCFIHDSYACRKGKGVHRAVDRYQNWAQRYPYALKVDVQQYFPSIDHDILKEKLRRRIRDHRVIHLLDQIIDSSPEIESAEPVYFPGDGLFTPLERRRGIPIGNLTSQFFANLYLDDLDHRIKEVLRARGYMRYVDDMVVLDDDKERLHEWQEAIQEWLAMERLRLHPRKAHVSRTRDGLNLLGYFVFRRRRRLRNDNGFRFRRRLRGFAQAYAEGRMNWEDFDPSVQAWIGHVRHAETLGLRRQIFAEVEFIKGNGPKGGQRVIRGGSWNNKPRNVRSANRNRNTPDNRNNNVGFRLASPPAFSPEPVRSRTCRAWPAGVHEPVSRPRKEGSAE